MENQVNNRLRMLIKKENLSQKSFCDIIGISWGTLNSTFKRDSNPGTDILIKISDKFPQYSIYWLLTGEGSMEIANTSTEINIDYKKKYYELLEENKELSKKYYQLLESEIESQKTAETDAGGATSTVAK